MTFSRGSVAAEEEERKKKKKRRGIRQIPSYVAGRNRTGSAPRAASEVYEGPKGGRGGGRGPKSAESDTVPLVHALFQLARAVAVAVAVGFSEFTGEDYSR